MPVLGITSRSELRLGGNVTHAQCDAQTTSRVDGDNPVFLENSAKDTEPRAFLKKEESYLPRVEGTDCHRNSSAAHCLALSRQVG